ncbi:hypothetical protein Tco_1092865 [Tanacetum coccineum]|uniref:Integrase, catalytic region, zinc finger, CCHC-type, peptidase aspartic, catalytic n=1 Tax=Tanacetum coccineum TaxID=301880 RepID=A0ABQ5ID16_9ASTR
MLAPKCPTFNGRPTFANLMYLKKAQYEKPCLYEIPHDQSDPANRLIPDREEILTLEEESRSKLNKDLVKPYDYTRENKIVDQAWVKHSNDRLHLRSPTAQDMEILIKTCLMPLALKTQNDSFAFVHELKQEMHADLKYVESLEDEIDETDLIKAGHFLYLGMDCLAQSFSEQLNLEGYLSLLCNFVEKYLGTVHFGNDQFALILGYGDLVQGNITINRVYYVEGKVDFTITVIVNFESLYNFLLKKQLSSTPNLSHGLKHPLTQQCMSRINYVPLVKWSYAKRSSFKSKYVQFKGRLNLLHMDLCGPMRVASINGKKYIMILALSWKPCQGDSLNSTSDHGIHNDGDDSRIMKASRIKDKRTFRPNSVIQRSSFNDIKSIQGRLLSSFQMMQVMSMLVQDAQVSQGVKEDQDGIVMI